MCPYVYNLYLKELEMKKKAAEKSKPQIDPAIVKASSDAGKLVTEAIAIEITPLLKGIMRKFHDSSDTAHQAGDKTSHQVNCMAANKVAMLIQQVYKL
jgi:hypothetical protein